MIFPYKNGFVERSSSAVTPVGITTKGKYGAMLSLKICSRSFADDVKTELGRGSLEVWELAYNDGGDNVPP